MPKGFEPWIAVKVGVRKNRKLAGLPDDTARYGWIAGVLAEAKLQRPGGRFDSRGQLEEAIGRFAPYVDNYLSQGLIEVAGRLCSRCRTLWKALPAGSYVVHDWRAHQRDPFSAARAEAWRGDHDPEHENGDRTTDERSANDGRTTNERATNANGSQNERPTNTVDSRHVTVDSRARGKTQDSRHRTRDESDSSDVGYPAPGAGEPLLDERQLAAWRPYRRHQWDTFRAAWFARGFRLPPAGDPDDPRSQAHVVWEILDNRGAELADWVDAAPGKTSHAVVAHLIERWQAIKAEAGVEDDIAGPAVDDDPTSTPESAREILGRLAAGLAERPAWAASDAAEDRGERAEVAS